MNIQEPPINTSAYRRLEFPFTNHEYAFSTSQESLLLGIQPHLPITKNISPPHKKIFSKHYGISVSTFLMALIVKGHIGVSLYDILEIGGSTHLFLIPAGGIFLGHYIGAYTRLSLTPKSKWGRLYGFAEQSTDVFVHASSVEGKKPVYDDQTYMRTLGIGYEKTSLRKSKEGLSKASTNYFELNIIYLRAFRSDSTEEYTLLPIPGLTFGKRW